MDEIVKKISKRLYFLLQLKRAKVPELDLILLYITCIRSIIDYAIPVFYHTLPNYLKLELERLQKRAMAIIYPSLSQHYENICSRLFNDILDNPSHILHNLLPSRHEPKYDLWNKRTFILPKTYTNRFGNSFINKMSRL